MHSLFKVKIHNFEHFLKKSEIMNKKLLTISKVLLNMISQPAGVVKLVDAVDSKSTIGDNVSVRVRPPVLKLVAIIATSFFTCTAQEFNDPWGSFNAEHWGISQTEFQEIRQSRLSPEKTIELLSLGIRPREYLSSPWKSLGISEKAWLEGRDLGFEDSELMAQPPLIPTSAWLNLALPGSGDLGHGRPLRGSLSTASALALWTGSFLLMRHKDPDSRLLAGMALGTHLLSFSFGFQADPRLLGGHKPHHED